MLNIGKLAQPSAEIRKAVMIHLAVLIYSAQLIHLVDLTHLADLMALMLANLFQRVLRWDWSWAQTMAMMTDALTNWGFHLDVM